MADAMTDEARFELLLRRSLDELATQEERESFCDMLRDRPQRIAEYAGHLELLAVARCLGGEGTAGLRNCGGVPCEGAAPRREAKRETGNSKRRVGAWWKVAAAVAAVLAGAALWRGGMPETPAPSAVWPDMAAPNASAPQSSPSALVLVETVSAEGLGGAASELPEPGVRGYVSSILLESGCYTFRLETGATCCLVGPAAVEFRDDSHVFLSRGTLLTEIEPQAVGFTVETPLLRVRDLGTRFGVAVTGSGTTDVLVAQGRVMCEDALGRPVMPLNSGNGVRVAASDSLRMLMASGPMPGTLADWRRQLFSGTKANEEAEMRTRTTVVSMGVAAVMSSALTSLYAGDGAWTGTGAGALDYWDASNWLNGQVANGAGSAAYFTNALNPKIVLTNDVTLGYLQFFAPAASNAVTFEGSSLTLQGSTLTIRADNHRVDFRTVLRGGGGFTKVGNQAFYPYRKSEMTGTVKMNEGTLGIDFREDADSTNALALNHLQPDGLIFGGGHVRVGGRPNRPADQTGVFTLSAGNRRVTRVSGVTGLNLSAGQQVTAGAGVLPDGTFLKSIVDDNTVDLSAAPLTGGDETLTFKKASFSSVQTFNTLQTSVSGALYVGLGGDATTVRVGELSGGYGLTGDGSATIEIQNTRDFGGVVALTNTLTLAMTDQRALPTEPAANPAFRVDASATNTMTLVFAGGETQVTRWNDLTNTPTTDGTDVRFAAVRAGFTNPRLLTNALNGLPVVDFRAAGSKCGLVWRDALGGIRTVFMVVGSQEGGGILLGTKDGNTCSFERGMDVYASKGDWAAKVYTTPLSKDHALFLSLAAPPSNAAWLNGQAVDFQYAGLSGGYDLLSFAWNQDTTGGSASGFAMRGGMATPYFPERSGGQRLAEVILYQRVLTDQERRDTEAYLCNKWFGKALPGYGAPKLNTLRVNGGGNALEQAGASGIEADSLSVRNGATLTVKANTEVTVKSASLAGSVALAGGTLRVGSRLTPLAPAAQCALHLDATTNLTFSGSEVTRWDDCDGGSRYAFGYSGFSPSIVSNALNGLPVVDFGAIGSKKFLAWDTNVVVRSLFLVMKVASDFTAPIGTYQPMMPAKSHFTRQVPQIWSPAGQVTVRSGTCYLDGERVNPGLFNMTVNSFVLLGQVMEGSSIANAFACEAYLYTDPNNRANRTGGLQLAEVLIYNRKLSEQESLDTQAYLNWKWFGRVSGGYAAPGGSMSLGTVASTASASQSTLVIVGDAPVSLGQISGNGSFLLNSAVPVTVGSLATQTGGLKLTNTTVTFSMPGTLSVLDILGTCRVSVNGGAPVTAGALIGDGTLVKTGDGTLTVNNGSGFSGSLALRGGTLALGSGAQLEVASLTGADAALTGGSIAAAQVNAGLESADVGTLALSSLTLTTGATVTVNVSGQSCDRMDVAGALSVAGGGSFLMTFENNPGYAGQYTVFTFGSMDAQSVANLQGWAVAGGIPAKFTRKVLVKDGKVMLSISASGTVVMVK